MVLERFFGLSIGKTRHGTWVQSYMGDLGRAQEEARRRVFTQIVYLTM